MTEMIPSSAPQEIQDLIKKMSLEAEAFGSGIEVTMGIMGKILNATSEDDIFGAANGGMMSSKEYVQTPFRLKEDGLTARKSTVEDNEGFPYYWILTVTEMESGEEVMVSAGGASAVATLSALRDNGILAKYEDQGGMPLFFFEKPAKNGSVILLKPWRGGNGSAKK